MKMPIASTKVSVAESKSAIRWCASCEAPSSLAPASRRAVRPRLPPSRPCQGSRADASDLRCRSSGPCGGEAWTLGVLPVLEEVGLIAGVIEVELPGAASQRSVVELRLGLAALLDLVRAFLKALGDQLGDG